MREDTLPFHWPFFTGGFIPAFARCCLPVLRSAQREGGCIAANLLVFTSPIMHSSHRPYHINRITRVIPSRLLLLVAEQEIWQVNVFDAVTGKIKPIHRKNDLAILVWH